MKKSRLDQTWQTTPRHLPSLLAAVLSLLAAGSIALSQELEHIELACVDEDATGYGTFQSHNQKVLANANGIFMTHIRTRNEPYTAQQWRLSRSTDGGRTFATVYEETNATNPAPIESDEHGNVYLVRPDFVDNNSYLYTFFAADEYKKPRITTIPASSGGKFALAYDRNRRQLYYASNKNTFHVLGLDGTVIRSLSVLEAGKRAVLQYPLLCIDAENTLHYAWTTSLPERYLYWDIHYMKSADGGTTWTRMDDTPLALPIASDDSGPSDRISLDDEFEVHTWLSNFCIRDGKSHFLYQAGATPPQQHYMRYDLASASRELDITPQFKGNVVELNGLDGFFAMSEKTLYCVGHTSDGRIGCLASDDNGATWRDHALSGETLPDMYALGGCRDVTTDAKIIGSFTSTKSTAADATTPSKVYFLQIRAGDARPSERQ